MSSTFTYKSCQRKIIFDLEDRFGHPDLLVNQQMSYIKYFPNIPENKLQWIVELADKTRSCKNFLQNCGCGMCFDNPLLVRELSSKLPDSKKLEWVRHELSLTHRPH